MHLERNEKAILQRLLGEIPFEGSRELFDQIPFARVEDRSPTWVNLTMASGAARARFSRRVIPVEGRTLRDGEPAGGVLIFVEHGFLSAIEHFWYEAMPATLPLASEMVVERSRVTHTERRFWRFRKRRREL